MRPPDSKHLCPPRQQRYIEEPRKWGGMDEEEGGKRLGLMAQEQVCSSSSSSRSSVCHTPPPRSFPRGHLQLLITIHTSSVALFFSRVIPSPFTGHLTSFVSESVCIIHPEKQRRENMGDLLYVCMARIDFHFTTLQEFNHSRPTKSLSISLRTTTYNC